MYPRSGAGQSPVLRSSRLFCSAFIFLLAAGISTAQAQTTPQPVCGLEVYPSPTGIPDPDPALQSLAAASAELVGDPCTEGESIFGPRRFEKGRGLAKWEFDNFTVGGDDNAEVCIRSSSSGFMDPRKAWPFVALDGSIIVNPLDLRDLMDEQIHELAPGSHELAAYVIGLKGAFVDVEVRQIQGGGDDGGGDDGGDPNQPLPGETRIDPETGAIDMVNADGSVRLQNAATDHPLLTPGDTTVFQALVTPLNNLPGKDDGSVDYFLDWEVQITNLDPSSCATVDAGLTGSTQINSPTLINVTWDGRDFSGATIPDGTYAYIFIVTVVDAFGVSYGTIISPAFGIVIDSTVPDYDERVFDGGVCDPATDPSDCHCPGVDGAPGTPDPNCTDAVLSELLPELGLPAGQLGNYGNPSLIDKSFITTTQDPANGRYTVTVDLRDYNAGGLVPNGFLFFANEGALRQWVSDMTGVPAGAGDSLFNFDYVQIGTSTSVKVTGLTNETLNHFLLDAMSDEFGRVRVGTLSTTLTGVMNNDVLAPPAFQVTNPRDGDECNHGGNTDGINAMSAKFCAYNSAFVLGDVSSLGVYALRSTAFDVAYNGKPTTMDRLCTVGSTSFSCVVRTFRVPADMEIESSLYVDNGGEPLFTRTVTTQADDTTALSFSADRGDGEDGVCSRAVTTRDGLAVRVDAADGAVPDTCVINGIF